ncbi:hypothetical protein BD410DRAFT_781466 [Rickenella mellea]|uniref:Poly A polymerase head domain-containing protein n=1 Tax=Rickenella mellea TaxID=50990 RepID=A0A4Y7QP95_9AGAM|nr:hypothetical protein BD410DRAFT_781466 [Rickenella mellea]
MSRSVSFKHYKPSSPAKPPQAMSVKLTDVEQQVCDLLDECKRDLEEKGQRVECRIAGGWVRDKLLGSESNDIDIALSDMMGVTFAEHFVSFVSSKGFPVKAVAKIARNPEQSKHLETAKTTVLGLELDFVNLRSEEYAENSRIPTQIRFGTPLEDALRRDITINALFYNVHSRLVEDHTGKGLEDLKNGIIRTPLPPKETFKDDPLRVIRCVRFASRFGFQLVPELEEAARDNEIQLAVASKISRERVGEELDKMLKGRDPLHAVQLINGLCLQPSLFSVPTIVASTFSAQPFQFESSLGAASILHGLTTSPTSLSLPPLHHLLTSQISTDISAKPRLYLSSILTPYKGITYIEKKKIRPAVEAAIREGLKMGAQNHYLDGIPALFLSAELLSEPNLDKFPEPSQRVKIGLLLRDKLVHNANTGSHWTSSLLFSLVQDLVRFWDPENDAFEVTPAIRCVDVYNSFAQRVEDLDLVSSIDARPIVDGREVLTALGINMPGSWTGQVLSKIIEWQLQHPAGSKDECIVWLKGQQAEGVIVTDDGPSQKRLKSSKDDGRAKKPRRD